jgi:hypothetical protein
VSEKTCNARMWSYDHWHCQREPHLFGRHRTNNYTGSRIPHVWRIRTLLRYWRTNQKWKRDYYKPGAPNKPRLMSYRQVLFPDHYDPIPVSAKTVAEARAYEAQLAEQERDEQ